MRAAARGYAGPGRRCFTTATRWLAVGSISLDLLPMRLLLPLHAVKFAEETCAIKLFGKKEIGIFLALQSNPVDLVKLRTFKPK
jgi:hypothetical protein